MGPLGRHTAPPNGVGAETKVGQIVRPSRAQYAARKVDLLPAAVKLRASGHTLKEIGAKLLVPPGTLRRWPLPRITEGTPRQPIVDWDPADGCWYIYVHDKDDEGAECTGISWWPVRWLKFASREAAEQHLALRGAP